jgi:cell shape-determining protein MreC
MQGSERVREISGERVGSALRKLAEDLVTERRRVAQLERENRELRRELEQVQRLMAEREVEAALTG